MEGDYGVVPVGCETDGDRVRSVAVRGLLNGDGRTLVAPYFVDATELGDLLALAKVEHITGFESQRETNELMRPVIRSRPTSLHRRYAL